MGLDGLLSRLEGRGVTAGASPVTGAVTREPAPALARTPATAATSPPGPGGETRTAHRWRLHFDGRDPLLVTFSPEASRAQVLRQYPTATEAEPVARPPPAPLPDDVARMFRACVAAGLYVDDGEHGDQPLLESMFADDPAGTRALVAQMHGRIGRCRTCRHGTRPGRSDGYCVERGDLALAYGNLYELPPNGGATCELFKDAEA